MGNFVRLDSLFYFCKERLWVKPRPEWQWCPQGPFYPLYLSVPGFLHCLENTAAAAVSQDCEQHLYFFLAGPAHWVQSSWDISNIGLTWYISFVSHTTQIWKQKSFDWYKNTIKDILHLVNEQDSQYFGKEKEEWGKGLMKLFTLKFYNKAKWLLKTRQNLWKNQTL